MSAGERVYHHGRMALVSAAITVAVVVVGMSAWKPAMLIGIWSAAMAGWHIGGVAWHSWRAR